MAKGPTARAADSDVKARGDLQRKYYCPHGRPPSRCKDCGGGAFCEHGRRRSHCKQCGGSSFCEHLRQRSRCKECGTFPERAALAVVFEDSLSGVPHPALPARARARSATHTWLLGDDSRKRISRNKEQL